MTELSEHYAFVESMSESGRKTLESHVRWHTASSQVQLLARGDEIGGVYLVTKGALRVFHIREQGRENTLYWVGPGDFCITAMNCLFNDVSYPAWVSADGDVRFAVVPGSVFRQLFDTEQVVRDFTVSVMSERIFELMSTLAEAVSFGVEQRLAALILRKLGKDQTVAMSQDVMANHLGTAREVVSRVLRSWSAQGLVKTRRGAIDVVRIDALAALLPAAD